jgi:hypothetical protein
MLQHRVNTFLVPKIVFFALSDSIRQGVLLLGECLVSYLIST